MRAFAEHRDVVLGNQHGPSRVYLNVARWVRGDAQFGQDLASYHLYMINHEVGHALGHFTPTSACPTAWPR